MATNDIRDARQLIAEINHPAERPLWAWWAPGDATRYHVTLLKLAALGWTPESDRDTSYRSTDHRDITAALAPDRSTSDPRTSAERVIELLNQYGQAKFGDEWWPGNADAWLNQPDADELATLLDELDHGSH